MTNKPTEKQYQTAADRPAKLADGDLAKVQGGRAKRDDDSRSTEEVAFYYNKIK